MVKSDNPKKNKHLTLEDRQLIEDCLQKRMTFKAIAKLIEKDPTTVSYEVKHHRIEQRNSNTSIEDPCPLLLKAPFVCNGCKKRYSCRYVFYYCRASNAFQKYREDLSSSREGIPLNKAEFYETDRIISSGLKKGPHNKLDDFDNQIKTARRIYCGCQCEDYFFPKIKHLSLPPIKRCYYDFLLKSL